MLQRFIRSLFTRSFRSRPKAVLANRHVRLGCELFEDRVVPTLCCGDFLTYTQGGWGAPPNGNNPGTYLHANFAAAFSNGLQIGDQTAGAATANNSAGNWAALLTSASVVTAWLPHTGPSGPLGGDTVNPVGEPDNDDGTLAGQTAALTLNVGFDLYDPAFSPSTTNLQDLTVTSGPFAGQTVQFVLDTCNAILAGVTTTGYTAAQANDAATAINENFDNGSANGGTDNGYLDCECVDDQGTLTIEGRKFEDLNGNGVDNGDPGIGGWEIDITVGPDSFTISTGNSYTYDADTDTLVDVGDVPNGGYAVTVNNIDVSGGPVAYSIAEVNQAGWTQTFGSPGYSGEIEGDDALVGQSFGNFENIDISGLKYTDENGDSSLAGESPGTPGQTFTINLTTWTDAGTLDGLVQDGELAFVAATETDDVTGAYSFTNLGPLPAGTQYYVREVGEAGWTQTFGNAGYTVVAGSGADSGGNDLGNFENIDICGVKFYDADADGMRDDNEPGINGWNFGLDTNGDTVPDLFATTAGNTAVTGGTFCFTNLGPGTYTVYELDGLSGTWLPTTDTSAGPFTASSGDDVDDLVFGNVKLGAGGGHTLGFWSNKNGQNTMNDGGTLAPELAMLGTLNLRNANGSHFDPANYTQFRSWLLGATATNMANMLSAQLAAMALNVEAGFVSGGSLVYAPGATGANTLGFISISALMAEANGALGADGYTPSGDPNRAYQELLKNALDDANNNLNFLIALSAWTDTNGNGVIDPGEI